MSIHLTELRKQREDRIAQMRVLIDVSRKENRGMNGEETKKFDALDGEIIELIKAEEREAKVAGLEAKARPAPAKQDVVEPTTGKLATKEKKEAKPFESFGEFLQSVRSSAVEGNSVDSRLLEIRAATGLGESIPSDGGYLVQKDFIADIMQRVYETGVLASRCMRMPVSGNGIRMPANAETSRATGSRLGGIQAYWAGEGDQKTASKPSFRIMEMNLQKLVGLAYVTDEMLADAPFIGRYLQQGFGQEFGFQLDDAIFRGDGVGKPLGIINSPSLVNVAIESGPQTTDTIVTANIVKMRARLWARSRANAVWLYNQDVEPQLHQLTLGAAGSNLAVYLPGGSLAGRPYDTIMGIPSLAIEQAATLGDANDINLFDLSQYMLIEKGGLQADVSMHVRFIYDESTFRFVMRVNGQPLWDVPLTPYKGSATQSPFIGLATR